jgi:outer membrane receptor protein involved in Fe transport
MIEARSAIEGTTNNRDYIDFFPSVFLSYDLGKDYSVQVSYSRRLSRPWFRQLLPFSSFSDARSIWVGNPDLNPEYTHSMEISFLKDYEKGSFLISPYYRYTTGPMERILIVDSVGNSFSQSQNLDHRHAVGLEVSYQQTLAEWWDLNVNVNLFYNELEAGPGLDYLDASAFSGGGRLMSKWHLPWEMDVQASVGVQAPRNTSQGFSEGIYTLDLSLSQKLLDGQGILSASVRDVFNSRVWRSNLSQPDFTRISEFQWAQRQFTLSFSYYFNQQPRMQRGMGGGGGGEEF